MQDEAIAAVLQQNHNDLEETLDQLLAMQYEVSDQSAEAVAAAESAHAPQENREPLSHATPAAHDRSATNTTSAPVPDHSQPRAEGGGEAAENGEELVDTLVGLLLDQPPG
eukprot:960093-Rhodomonas_salina.1